MSLATRAPLATHAAPPARTGLTASIADFGPVAYALVGLLAAVPTLVAIAAGADLVLDDLEFATIARFDGLAGFNGLDYRIGGGAIHGLQFTFLGTNAAAHLVVLALANALTLVLYARLVRCFCSPGLTWCITIAALVLPNRGSTHYWVSTVPNHIALSLVLAAAIAIFRRPRSAPVPWLAATPLLICATLTYEGGVLLAGIVIAAAVVRQGWHSWPKGLAALGAVSTTAALMVLSSPRTESSSLLAEPIDGLIKHLSSLSAMPLAPWGALLVPASIVWVVLDRSPARRTDRHVAIAGLAIAIAGLLPFLVAGYNLQNYGVLDRGHFFADFGTAMVLGSASHAAIRAAPAQARRAAATAAVALVVLAAAATLDDLSAYRAASDDLADAREALRSVGANDGPIAITAVPLHDGVGWAHYSVQVRNLWQLVHDEPDAPEWLSLTGRPQDASVPVFTIADGGTLIPWG